MPPVEFHFGGRFPEDAGPRPHKGSEPGLRAAKRTYTVASFTVRGRPCRASGSSHFQLARMVPGANAHRGAEGGRYAR